MDFVFDRRKSTRTDDKLDSLLDREVVYGVNRVGGERKIVAITNIVDMYFTLFSPPDAPSLLVGILDNTIDARRYVEIRRLGWWILLQNKNVDTEIKELFLDQRRKESIERVFKGIPQTLGDTHDVLMVDVACMVYITTANDL
ncbi:hypothetical protein MKW92_013093, partial [Papaver armeniacum]